MKPELKYIVIEDSLKVCSGIKERIDDFPEWTCCGFAHHVSEAIKIIESTRPGLIFLDWALKGGSAYDVLSGIVNLPSYNPYIIFNTGYQSENPEIPQEIINNYKIDKYLVKPLWEKLRLNLSQYLKEAALKNEQPAPCKNEIWITDILKKRHHINVQNIVCVQQHFDTPYYKVIHFSNGTSLTLKISWSQINNMLEDNSIPFFVTNSREHLVIKNYIQDYKRPFVRVSHFKSKIEVVKNKLSAFEKWMIEETGTRE
jgi:CheY-like chemotaxis protein